MADEKKRITAYPTASSIGDDDYVMLDNGQANGTKKFKAKDLGGGSRTIELLAGDITATYTGATPSYALPTTDTSLPDGKHWLDYDEIVIVTIYQQSPSSNVPRLYEYKSIPTWAFETGHNDSNYGITVTCTDNFNGSAGHGARVCLLADDKYRNDWYNYASPIAILGIKY